MAAMLNSSTAAPLVASVALLVGILMFNTSLILVFITVLLILWLSTRRPAGFPPGPPLLPLVGNIFQMDNDPRVAFSNLRRQYGDIFSVYFFYKPIIVLNGYKVIKEALVKNADVFSYRPHSFLTDVYSEEKGILSTNGAPWKDIRKFTVVTLRKLGMASSNTEEKIQQEVNLLLKAIENEDSKDFYCKDLMYTATANITTGLCFGKRHYNYNDSRFTQLLDAIEDIFTDIGNSNIVDLFPVVRLLPGDLFNYKRLVRNIAVLRKELAGHIKESVDNYDEDNVVDFATAFIKEVRRSKHERKAFDESHLQATLIDLFIAGTTDTGNSLVWSILYLLHYPEVQEKCFQQIKEYIGLERRPTMMDKPNLPYVEAMYSEVMRHADMVPTGVPYTVPCDVQFMGYTFPKGVTILPVLNSVLHDEAAWGDPQNFRPERFLDDKGNFQKREELVPFSVGRRACTGQPLVRMEQFLILSTLIQRFKFVPPSGTLSPLTGIMGIVHSAPPFKCRAIRRNV